MEFRKAFPIAIIDEDYEGKNAAGRGMQQLAAQSKRKDFASSPASATRMRGGFRRSSTTNRAGSSRSTASEDAKTRWQVLEEVLASKRAATTGCRSSCSATSSLPKWCRRVC